MKKSLRILIVNESGCFDPGLIALAKTLGNTHRVCVVAPLRSLGGRGHMLTIDKPLRPEQFFLLNKVKLFGVGNAMPCDCVGLALDKLLKAKPDLIIAGIDAKNNRGEIMYSSGCVAAAQLGTMNGIRSIAVSADIENPKAESSYSRVVSTLVKMLPTLYKHIKPDITMNINFPRKFSAKKIKLTHMTCDMLDNNYMHETNPFGLDFYWLIKPITGYSLHVLDSYGDIYWLKQGYITVTPLRYDLTSDDAFDALQRSGIGL